MTLRQPYTIRKIQEDESMQVIAFMMRIRQEIFPMLSQDELPQDLRHFNEYYNEQESSAMFAALLKDGTVVGTIGIRPYDDRFDPLEKFYHQFNTAEIIKCYVDPQYRRLGLGTILFDQAVRFCNESAYEKLYLHTHPFLPGAIPFWKSKGFEERLAEDDPIWNTLHMDMKL